MKFKYLVLIVLLLATAVGLIIARNYQLELGMRALNDENGVEAVKHFQILANLGDKKAQYFLGDIYAHGWGGIQKNDSEAIRWFRHAAMWVADETDPAAPAELEVSKSYANGQNTEKVDKAESIKWLKLAAEGGSKEAAVLLAKTEQRK
jgi:uncharacterized protein